MTDAYEQSIAKHYQVSGLTQRILDAAAAAGLDPENLNAEDLGTIDEFHIGGRAATRVLVSKMRLAGREHVLDIGCGIGGAARYLSSASGCRVTGIDLTPEYVEAACLLSARTGLAAGTAFEVASALRLPFADVAFDAAMTLHAAMNIKDRAGLYGETARVLKPGAVFGIYDVMQGKREGLRLPVPWAEAPEDSYLATLADMTGLLASAGFSVEEIDDRTEAGIAFFRERLSAGPSPLGLQILMGPTARVKAQNLLQNLEQGFVAAVMMIARRAA